MFVFGFHKKEGQVSLAGFEPTASQIRGNINQPALPGLLQRTMLINSITENSLRNKITDVIINDRNEINIFKLKFQIGFHLLFSANIV